MAADLRALAIAHSRAARARSYHRGQLPSVARLAPRSSADESPLVPADTRLARSVADLLRAQIARRELKPGERLVPAQIAQDLGVSRGPVREAIAELVQQGLVEQSPRRAAFVRGLSAKDVTQLSRLRGLLEGLAVRLASERLERAEGKADLEELQSIVAKMKAAGERNDRRTVSALDATFHDRLTDMAEFPTLTQILRSLRTQIRPLIEAANAELDASAVWRQHEAFVTAIRQRDQDRLEKVAADHARAAGERINADGEGTRPGTRARPKRSRRARRGA